MHSGGFFPQRNLSVWFYSNCLLRLCIYSFILSFVGELYPAELSWPLQMRINLPRHDLLEEKRLTNFSEKGLEDLFPWAFIGFSLHTNTGHICKAHQSVSGSNDQGIDNIQKTVRAYSESGSDR